jgi:hypothetical protein
VIFGISPMNMITLKRMMNVLIASSPLWTSISKYFDTSRTQLGPGMLNSTRLLMFLLETLVRRLITGCALLVMVLAVNVYFDGSNASWWKYTGFVPVPKNVRSIKHQFSQNL